MKPPSSYDLYILIVGPCKITVEREALQDLPNVYCYQAFVETERAGYALRQWVASSLYDRIRFVACDGSRLYDYLYDTAHAHFLLQ